jgi:hypothetical protein
MSDRLLVEALSHLDGAADLFEFLPQLVYFVLLCAGKQFVQVGADPVSQTGR